MEDVFERRMTARSLDAEFRVPSNAVVRDIVAEVSSVDLAGSVDLSA